MTAPIPVALLGFSAFERSALASYFRIAEQRQPRYQHVLDIDEARFIVADADQSGVPDLLQALGRVGDAVFIGAHSPGGAASWMMRPIDPNHVLRELDGLVTQRDNPGSGPLPLVSPPGAGRAADAAAAAPQRRADDGPPSGPMDLTVRRATAAALRAQREARLRPNPLRRALLVDDSELALHFLDRQLKRYGLETEWATTSAKALELLARVPFGFVFLDIDLGPRSELDGLALCQPIKHQHVHPGGRAPLVVMVSAFAGPVDRVRSTLAGADAHLPKPLELPALDLWLRQQGLERGPEPSPSAVQAVDAVASAAPVPGPTPGRN